MNIILPGETRDEFWYGRIHDGDKKFPIAMFKIPASLTEGKEQDDENVVLWYLDNRCDDEDGIAVSRYELKCAVIPVGTPPVDNLSELQGEKDGYVYFPKAMRDGRHPETCFIVPIEETEFTPKVERGMFEEVAWSPFGSIAEAVKQETANLERNHLLRRWQSVE